PDDRRWRAQNCRQINREQRVQQLARRILEERNQRKHQYVSREPRWPATNHHFSKELTATRTLALGSRTGAWPCELGSGARYSHVSACRAAEAGAVTAHHRHRRPAFGGC